MQIQKYKIPYPQQILNGKSGLSSKDIAEALDIEHKHILEKINRPEFKAMCSYNNWELVAAATNSKGRGRPGKVVSMETNIAKAFVATTAKKEGWGYLKFLLDCERVATELMPKLIKQNEELKKELASLTQKKLSGKRTNSIPAPVSYAEDIFGETQVMEIRWVKKTDLSELELARAIKRHCLAVGAGAINRAKELDEKADSTDRKIHYKVKKLLS